MKKDLSKEDLEAIEFFKNLFHPTIKGQAYDFTYTDEDVELWKSLMYQRLGIPKDFLHPAQVDASGSVLTREMFDKLRKAMGNMHTDLQVYGQAKVELKNGTIIHLDPKKEVTQSWPPTPPQKKPQKP